MRRRPVIIFLVLLALLVGGSVVFLRSDRAAEMLCSQLELRIGNAIDGDLSIDRCEVRLPSMEIAFSGLRVDSASMGVYGTADAAILRFRPWQGLSDISLDRLEVHGPSLFVDLSSGKEEVSGGPKEPDRSCGLPEAIVRVSTARVSGGTLTLLMGGGGILAVGGVELDAVRHGRRQVVDLSVSEGRISGGPFDEPFVGLQADLEIDQPTARISVRRASVTSGDLTVGFRGRLQDLCELRIEGSINADGGMERIADLISLPSELMPVEGRVRLSSTIDGSISSPRVGLTGQIIEGSMKPVKLGDVELAASFDKEGLSIERIHSSIFGGALDVSGRVEFDERLSVALAVSGEALSVSDLVVALGRPGSWVDAAFSPTGELRGSLSPISLSGRIRAPIDDFFIIPRYASLGPPQPGEALLALPPLRLEGEIGFDQDEIRLRSARLSTPYGWLDIDGRFPLRDDQEISVKGRAQGLIMENLGPIVGTDYEGRLSGPVELRGTYGSPRIMADLEVEDFVFSGLAAGNVNGRLRYGAEVLSVENMRGRLPRSRYLMERFALDLGDPKSHLDLQVNLEETMIEELIESFIDFVDVASEFVGVKGRARGVVGVKGPLDSLDLSFNVTASDGTIFAQPFRRARAMGRLAGLRRFELDEVVFTLAEEDTIVARGLAEIEGPLSVSLSAREVPSTSLFFAEDLPFATRFSGDLVLEGTWDHPRGRGVGLLIDSELGGKPVDDSRLRLALDGSRLFASGEIVAEVLKGSVSIQLWPPYAFWTDLEIDEADLMRWFPKKDGEEEETTNWRASAAGRARFGGLVIDLGTIEGLVNLADFAVSWDPAGEGGSASAPLIDLHSSEPVDIRVVEGGAALRRLEMAGSDLSLAVTGILASDGEMDFTVHSRINLDILEKIVPWLDHSGGQLDLEASVGGTTSSVVLVGSANVSGGQIRLDGFPMTVTGLRGPIAFSQNRVIIEGMTGTFGSGRLTLDGEVALDGLGPDSVELIGSLEEVRLRIPEEIQSTVSGQMVLSGPLSDLRMSGDLEVLRGRFMPEFEMEQILPNLRRRVVTPPARERDPVLGLDIRITAPSTIRIDNRTARGLLAADLRVVGTDVKPGLLGAVSVTEGSARFRGNEYEVTRGVIDFQDEQRIDPWFDVMAETEIRDYRVSVHAYGSPSEPRLFLSSDPPLPETDLVTLVTLGITSHESEAFGDALAAAAATDALFAMSGLDRHVREFIPDNPIFREPSFRITSGYSIRTGQVTPRFAFESSILVDELRLRYSAPIGLPGQKAVAEYRITEVVSAQAEWDTEGRRTTSLGNLGVDLKLRWEMD